MALANMRKDGDEDEFNRQHYQQCGEVQSHSPNAGRWNQSSDRSQYRFGDEVENVLEASKARSGSMWRPTQEGPDDNHPDVGAEKRSNDVHMDALVLETVKRSRGKPLAILFGDLHINR